MGAFIPITVLMSVYNGLPYLSDAIESILNQTFADFEFIIINDGSTDDTAKILSQYKDSRIKIINKSNSGLADSLNIGLNEARGKWIARLDADDIAIHDRLYRQLNFVKKNKGVALLGGGCIEIDKDGNTIKTHIYPKDHSALMNRIEKGMAFFPHSTAFFNKAYIMELGGYNHRYIRSQDKDLWLRIGEIGRIGCLQIPVVKSRNHSQMISNANNGNISNLMAICSIICHLRRKAGLTDPSKLDEADWQEFLKWVENRLEEDGFFRIMQVWQTFRETLYSYPKTNKFQNSKLLIKELIKNKTVLKAIWERIKRDNIAIKLFEESKTFFNSK